MNKYALITGASSGIGEQFAYQLAKMGFDLIITARRQDLLEKIAANIKSEYSREVIIIIADLSKQEGIDYLITKISTFDNIHYLVNNAGFSNVGTFEDVEWIKHQQMLMVHILASTQLMHWILPQMKKNNSGVIINLASIAAFVPSSVYGASKRYLVDLTKGLKKALKGYNITVQALTPAFTVSGFHKTEEFKKLDVNLYETIPSIAWMNSEDVVKISLKAVKKKKTVVVPGWRHKLTLTIYRLGLIRRPKALSKKSK